MALLSCLGVICSFCCCFFYCTTLLAQCMLLTCDHLSMRPSVYSLQIGVLSKWLNMQYDDSGTSFLIAKIVVKFQLFTPVVQQIYVGGKYYDFRQTAHYLSIIVQDGCTVSMLSNGDITDDFERPELSIFAHSGSSFMSLKWLKPVFRF